MVPVPARGAKVTFVAPPPDPVHGIDAASGAHTP